MKRGAKAGKEHIISSDRWKTRRISLTLSQRIILRVSSVLSIVVQCTHIAKRALLTTISNKLTRKDLDRTMTHMGQLHIHSRHYIHNRHYIRNSSNNDRI